MLESDGGVGSYAQRVRGSGTHTELLYGQGCLRSDRAACLGDAHPYWAFTNFGLDFLVRHYAREARLLARDDLAAVNATNARFQFLWEASGTQRRLPPCERIAKA